MYDFFSENGIQLLCSTNSVKVVGGFRRFLSAPAEVQSEAPFRRLRIGEVSSKSATNIVTFVQFDHQFGVNFSTLRGKFRYPSPPGRTAFRSAPAEDNEEFLSIDGRAVAKRQPGGVYVRPPPGARWGKV